MGWVWSPRQSWAPWPGKAEDYMLDSGAKSECSSVQSKETRSSKASQDLMGNPHNYIKCQPAFRARLWGCDSWPGQSG